MTPASASIRGPFFIHYVSGTYYYFTRRRRIRGRYSLQWVWRWRGWSGCSWGRSQRGHGNLAKGWRMRIEPRNRVTRYGIVKCVTYRITNGSPRWAAYDIFGWFFRIIRRIYFPGKKNTKIFTKKRKTMIRYFDLNSNALDKVQRDVATKILSISKGCMYHYY